MFFGNFQIPLFNGEIGGATQKKIAQYENSRTFMIIFARLINVALDYRYHFEGLPDTINERILKQSLLFYGNVTMYQKNGVPIALPSVPAGESLDIYGNYGASRVFSINGKVNEEVPLIYDYNDTIITNKNLMMGIAPKSNDKGVIVWENKTRVPFIWTVIYFAERIADTYRTLDTNRRWLKRPFIPRCEEEEKKSFEESLNAFLKNEDFGKAVTSRTLDKTDIFSVDFAPDTITKITELVEWYEAQYKQLCGIEAHTQVNKKGENLISDEIGVDNDYIGLNESNIIEDMQKQIDVYNNLMGLNIRVTANEKESDKKEQQTQEITNEQGEGEKNAKFNDI